MRIAWFRPTPLDPANPLDDSAPLIAALRSTHTIDVINESDAHDFVWRAAMQPWDLCVYELDSTAACCFEWGYLLAYPGIVLLRSTDARDTSAATPGAGNRFADYMSEFQVDRLGSGALRLPLLASRVVVVQSDGLARSLRERYAEARVRCAPVGIAAVASAPSESLRREQSLRVGLLGTSNGTLAIAAVERVRATGIAIDLHMDGTPRDLLTTTDVIVVAAWPPQTVMVAAAVAGMAAGKPVIALEMEATAEWPAFDPQTWKPRGQSMSQDPIAVTLDPLDDEHSLVRALTRLATDAPLRDRIGRAAHAWWLANATPAHAALAWRRILEDARVVEPPSRSADWPRHLDDDGTALARTLLREYGVETDL